MLDLLAADREVGAIKAVMEATGATMWQSKHLIEDMRKTGAGKRS